MISKSKPNAPIGIFDSGLGGLTVLKTLKNILPNESFIYLGDTANVPYGNKSDNTVIKCSKKILNFFISKNTKAVVIACNTASSIAYQELKKTYDIPIFDVVGPSVNYANKISKTQKICVIGTNSTINSNAYSNAFKKLNKKISIVEISCPLFVPIIEEGWSNTNIAKLIAEKYLHTIKNTEIDTLILGCTHYPIISQTIKGVINKNIQLIFSGQTVGDTLHMYLKKNDLKNTNKKRFIDFYVTDYPQKFNEIGSQFFGQKLNLIECIDLK
jgi:glutamate racemase